MWISWVISGVLAVLVVALLWRQRRSPRAVDTSSDFTEPYARILNAVRTATVLLDGERIAFANRAFLRLFDFGDAVDATLADRLAERHVNRTRLGGLTEGDFEATLPSGQKIDVTKSTATPIELDGRRFEIVQFTPSSRTDDAILEQRDRLASLGIMSAMVMHQLKSALQASSHNIAASIEELNAVDFVHNEQMTSVAEVYATLVDMEDDTERMATLVTDFAEFVSPQASTPGPVDLSTSAKRALRMLQSQTAANTRVEAELHTVPLVIAESLRVQQMLINLVTNAMQAVAGTNRTSVVTVRTFERDGRVHLEVEDDGPGIPAELHARIFDPMFTTKQRGEGSGLGLFIVRRIAEDLGATLELDSAPGRGTKFTLTFDRLVSRSKSGAVVLEPMATEGPASRILVVDQDLTTVGNLRARMPSWQLTVARSLEEGAALLERRAFDAVLIDASLSTDDVERTVNTLPADPGQRPHIVLMVRRGQDHQIRGWAEPAGCAVATKPIDARALVSKLSGPRPRP